MMQVANVLMYTTNWKTKGLQILKEPERLL